MIELLNPEQDLPLDLRSSTEHHNSFSFNQDHSKDPANFIYSSLSKMTPENNSSMLTSAIREEEQQKDPQSLIFKKSEKEEIEEFIEPKQKRDQRRLENSNDTKALSSSDAYDEVQRVYFDLSQKKKKSIFQMTSMELLQYHQQIEGLIKKKLMNIK